jgi:hypothetical protein
MFKQIKEYLTGSQQAVPETHVLKPFLYTNRPPVMVPTHEYLVSQRVYSRPAEVKKVLDHPSVRTSTFIETPYNHSTDNAVESRMRTLPTSRPTISNNPTAVLNRQHH